MESAIPFIAVDSPNASRLELHIRATLAEDELQRIRARTIEALAALKRQGVTLGNPNVASDASDKGHRAQRKLANNHNATVLPLAEKLRAKGYTLQQVADHLTARGLLTRRAKPWTPTAVLRLLA